MCDKWTIFLAGCQQVFYVEDLIIKTKSMKTFNVLSNVSNLKLNEHNKSNMPMILIDQNKD